MTLIGMSKEDRRKGVWAYGCAAAKLNKSEVGQAVLALGLENCSDHQNHQELFIGAIHDLGGTPVAPDQQFDLTSYLAMSTVT